LAAPATPQPKPDPILAVVKREAQPAADVADGEQSSDRAASGGLTAGRTTLDEAKRKGPAGFLQLLGPGLITGASDDDPSGIGT
jgi:hypothetical protein